MSNIQFARVSTPIYLRFKLNLVSFNRTQWNMRKIFQLDKNQPCLLRITNKLNVGIRKLKDDKIQTPDKQEKPLFEFQFQQHPKRIHI